MKLSLGRKQTDYGSDCCEDVPEKPKKMKTVYPSFYLHDVDLKGVDQKMVGKAMKVTAEIRIESMITRIDGKKDSKDSMDVEVMSIDFGKQTKDAESLQDAIEEGLSEE